MKNCRTGENFYKSNKKIPDEIIAENVKRLRIERGYKQDAVARAIGTTKSHISEYENGSRAISDYTLKQYAIYFNVSTVELCSKSINKHNSPNLEINTTKKYTVTNDNERREKIRKRLEEAIDKLPEPDKTIVRIRYGLDNGETKSVEEVAIIMNMDIRTIRNYETSALRALRGI